MFELETVPTNIMALLDTPIVTLDPLTVPVANSEPKQ